MRCTSPRPVGFKSDGKTISWSPKSFDPQYATFQLPCGKCINCRLEYSRQWAIRCMHEASCHKQNAFVTLTYASLDANAGRLNYRDVQLFFKKMREKRRRELIKKIGPASWSELSNSEKKSKLKEISLIHMTVGEYGTKTKRPHWHVILFNYWPDDARRVRTGKGGHPVFNSQELTEMWGHGHTEIGTVTSESAAYVARYSAKDLVHGDDGHDYKAICKRSTGTAIGRTYFERFYDNILKLGYVTWNNQKAALPRYYEKWAQKNAPDAFIQYLSLKSQRGVSLAAAEEKRQLEYIEANAKRGWGRPNLITEHEKAKAIAIKRLAELKTRKEQL